MPLRWLFERSLSAGKQEALSVLQESHNAKGAHSIRRSFVRLPRMAGIVPLSWLEPRPL